jgi:uncharacterized membrane protein
MNQDTTSLPRGAGATTGSSPSDASFGSSATTGSFAGETSFGSSAATTTTTTGPSSTYSTTPSRAPSSESGYYRQDEHESGYRSSARAIAVADRDTSGPSPSLIIGSALAGAVIGGALPFLLSGRSTSSRSRGETATVEETVTVNRPAGELYSFWRDFTNLPQFMDNIKSVQTLSDKRSHWVIKAPAGTSIEFDSYVVEDVPNRLIAWQSEEGASVPNRGRVEFTETSAGATLVRATVSYDPPGGTAGRMIAKLFQREPGEQARQDLARFKDVMENGRRP